MPAIKEMAGKRFGRWTVEGRGHNPTKSSRAIFWVCRCDCGSVKSICGTALRTGESQSCGCLSADKTGERRRKHGESKKSPEYLIWGTMKARCHRPNAQGYYKYGARGITVCQEWRDSYEAFLRDMGRRPSPKHSIDRIDNNQGYSPQNCRWATATQQMCNTRATKLSEEKAREIRERRAATGESYAKIGADYGVGHTAIWAVVTNRKWKLPA